MSTRGDNKQKKHADQVKALILIPKLDLGLQSQHSGNCTFVLISHLPIFAEPEVKHRLCLFGIPTVLGHIISLTDTHTHPDMLPRIQ